MTLTHEEKWLLKRMMILKHVFRNEFRNDELINRAIFLFCTKYKHICITEYNVNTIQMCLKNSRYKIIIGFLKNRIVILNKVRKTFEVYPPHKNTPNKLKLGDIFTLENVPELELNSPTWDTYLLELRLMNYDLTPYQIIDSFYNSIHGDLKILSQLLKEYKHFINSELDTLMRFAGSIAGKSH